MEAFWKLLFRCLAPDRSAPPPLIDPHSEQQAEGQRAHVEGGVVAGEINDWVW